MSLSATNRKFWVTFNAAHDSLVSFFKVELLQERLASAVPMLCYWLLPALEQVFLTGIPASETAKDVVYNNGLP